MLGIITEYNPFHNGHSLHIEKSKKETNSKYCVVVMSGNFVQRGEPAIFDKYIRTKMALLNGADLVIELPIVYATASAELFSLGAVDILSKTNIVSKICFGSEANNLDLFLNIADILVQEPINYKLELQKNLKEGLSYPTARAIALSNILPKNTNIDFLKEPNNILCLEYLKALKYLNNRDIDVFTIKREEAHFHSQKINLNSSIASATAIRKEILNNNLKSNQTNLANIMPQNCLDLINQSNPNDLNNYTKILSFLLRIRTPQDLSQIADITEGLENKILNNLCYLDETNDISKFISQIKSKRYTYTKIQRALLHIILNITKQEQLEYKNNLVPYIRVLGFKKDSQFILKELTQKSKVPIIMNLKNASGILDERGMYLLNKEITCSDIYYLNQNLPKNIEYTMPLVIL